MKLKLALTFLAAGAFISSQGAFAADVIKENNTNNLNLNSSWVGGVSQPGSGDVAVWDSTVTAANTTLLGGNLSWQGIRIADPTGLVTINTGSTLTLGTAGIDMSAATADFTLSPSVTIGGTQTWSVNTGRTLTAGGVVAISNALNLTGPGTIAFNAANTGTGTVTINSGTVRLTSTTARLGTGAMIINGGTIATSTGGADFTLTNSSYALNGDFTIGGAGSGKNYTFGTGAATIGGGTGITRQITFSGPGIALFSQPIGDGGNGNGLTKAGGASLVLSGANSYTGTTTVNGGTLHIGGTLSAGGIGGRTSTGSLSTSSAIVLTSGNLQFNRSNAVTQGTDFSGSAITGAGGIVQNGTAATVLTLNAANTYSGSTTVSSGVLNLANSLAIQNSTLANNVASGVVFNSSVVSNAFTVNGLNGSGTFALENDATTAIALTIGNNNGGGTQSGALTGGGSLIKTGSGEQILSADNTYAGTTNLSNGTLTLGAGSTTGKLNTASAITYGSGVTLAFNRSNAVAQGTDFDGTAIGGSVNIVQKGTSVSTVTLNAANTYTGTTTVTSGKLAAGVASVLNTSGAFGLNSAVTTANTAGAVLDITGFDTQIGSLAGGGTSGGGVTLGSNTLTIGGNNTNTSFAGIISGTGGVVKIGTGTQTLTGANSFTTGGLTIKSGTVSTSVVAGFGAGTITLGDSTGSLDATLFTSINGTTHTNNIVVQAGSSANTLKIDGSGLSRTFSGTVALNNNLVVDNQGLSQVNTFSGLVTEAASSALTLSKGSGVGNVTFSGGIAVGSGGLTLANNAATTGLLTVTGGVSGTGNLILNNNGVTASGISLSTASVNNIGTITNSGTGVGSSSISAAVGSNVTAITENSATSALTVSGGLTVNSSGTTLTNSNASGSSLLTLSGSATGTGDLVLNNNSAIANGVTISGTTVNNTGTVTNSGTGSGATSISSIIGTNVTGVTQNSANSALTLSGVNTFTNNGSTTFGLTVKNGTVTTGNASALGAGAVQLGDTTGTATASLLGGGLTAANNITVQNNAGANANILGNSGSSSTVFSGLVTLNDDLTVASGGTGTVNLSGAASGASLTGSRNVTTTAATAAATNVTIGGNNSGFTGNVTVGSGSLKVGGATALSSANTVAVTNVTGAVFDMNNFDQTIAGLNSVSGAGTGNVNNTGASNRTLTLGGSGTYAYAGSISPATTSRIALTKSGSGFQTLSGTNTFTGKTTISGGTLLYAQTASLYNSVGASWTAANITVGSGATLGLNVGGTGEFTSVNLNTLLTNISVAGAGTGLQSGARLAFDTTNASGGSFTQGNAIANSTGANGGAIGLTKLGSNALVLDKTNTYTGATTVSAGTLLVNGSLASGSAVTVATGATLGGNGTINGDTTINGTLAPGNSPDTLNFGGTLNLASGSTLAFELGTVSDKVHFTTLADSLLGSGNATLSLSLISGFSYGNTYTIFENVTTSGFNLAGITGYDTINYAAVFGQSGNNYNLSFTAVPEPSTYALLAMGLGSLWFLRRKSRKGV